MGCRRDPTTPPLSRLDLYSFLNYDPIVLKDGMKYFDISPEVSEKTAVFPGDLPFRREVALDFSKGDHLLLSNIATSVHVGAHTDAPNHYARNGMGIDRRELDRYLGPCQVISVRIPRGARILPEHVGVEIRVRRVLFHTDSFPDPNRWTDDFNSLSPELVDWLADRGVTLVGLDTPSVDPADSRELEAHQAIHRRDLAILEGVVLDGVPDGVYGLIALPLRLKDADASLVRAILVEQAAPTGGSA